MADVKAKKILTNHEHAGRGPAFHKCRGAGDLIGKVSDFRDGAGSEDRVVESLPGVAPNDIQPGGSREFMLGKRFHENPPGPQSQRDRFINFIHSLYFLLRSCSSCFR